jgi:quercetin dioxygenase-like cupin family protein
MDIVDALLGQHGVLYSQLDYLEEAAPQLSMDALKAQTDVLAAALQSHSGLEDELLFTSLGPVLGAGSPELLGMRMIHEELNRGLESCPADHRRRRGAGGPAGRGRARAATLPGRGASSLPARAGADPAGHARGARGGVGGPAWDRRRVTQRGRGSMVDDSRKMPEYLKSHRLRGEILRFAIEAEERTLRALAGSSGAGRGAKTLVKEGPLRITLVVLRRGAALEEHQVTGPVSIHVLSGRLRVDMRGGTITLAAGELAALDAGVAHAAEALNDAALLITVAMPSTIRDGDPSTAQGGTCDAPATPKQEGRSATD